jgi:hypothetical protein
MYIVFNILFALGIGLAFTAIFAGIFRRSGPWASNLVFFAIIFLAAWAGGVWIAPIGPALFGVYWIPYLFFGLIAALLLAAVAPSRPSRKREVPNPAEKTQALMTYDIFFILLIVALFIAIVSGYLLNSSPASTM